MIQLSEHIGKSQEIDRMEREYSLSHEGRQAMLVTDAYNHHRQFRSFLNLSIPRKTSVDTRNSFPFILKKRFEI